ncbi:MAG: hypothetical protein WCA07_04360 [Gloeobacterales cyanobacterium]
MIAQADKRINNTPASVARIMPILEEARTTYEHYCDTHRYQARQPRGVAVHYPTGKLTLLFTEPVLMPEELFISIRDILRVHGKG